MVKGERSDTSASTEVLTDGNPLFLERILCLPRGDNLLISAGHHPSLWELGWFLSNRMPGNSCWCVSGPPEYSCVPVETSQIHSDLLAVYWEKRADPFLSLS